MPTYAAPGVYVEEVPSSQKVLTAAATAIAAFVGFTGSAPDDDPNDPDGVKPRLVTSWTQFENLYGGYSEGCMLPVAVRGYFDNGGTIAYVVRVPNTSPSGQPSQLGLPAADNALGTPVAITSVEPDAKLSIVVENADVGSDGDGPSPFNISVVEGGQTVESYENLTVTAGDQNAEKVVNAASKKVKVKVNVDPKLDMTSLIDVMKPGTYPLVAAPATPVPVNGRRFAGSESARTGINGLAIAEDVTMVVVPDLVTAATKPDKTVDLSLWKAVQTSMITHCELHGNRMAVLDAPPGMNPQQIKEWRSDVAMYDSAFAAFYYPWIKVENPMATNGADRGDTDPALGAHCWRVGACRRDPRGLEGARQRDHSRVPGRRVPGHQGRAVAPKPHRRKLHPALRDPRDPNLGWSHLGLRHRLAVPQRPASVQHGRDDDSGRYSMGGVRTERREAVGRCEEDPHGFPNWSLARRRSLRHVG